MCGKKNLKVTRLDEIVLPDQSHTQYLDQIIPHMRQINEQVTLIQCCFNAGPASLKCPNSAHWLIGCGQPRDNTLPVCTFKQQSQKAVSAHLTSEQILPLQTDNVLQPVVWGRLGGRDIPTIHISPTYPLRLCNRLHCDIKTTDCGINIFYFKYQRTKNDIFVLFS